MNFTKVDIIEPKRISISENASEANFTHIYYLLHYF
jgi:hypothetical protein